MKIFSSLKRLVSELMPYDGSWAICGGVAASLYRETPRFTGDIDIALINSPGGSAREVAERVLASMGYAPKLGFIVGKDGKLRDGPALILAREDQLGSFVGIDFLLPVQTWIGPAVVRAQKNAVDYGFGTFPTITPEDLIIAKLIASEESPDRPHDIDDVISILKGSHKVDGKYILQSAANFKLKIPKQVLGLLPSGGEL